MKCSCCGDEITEFEAKKCVADISMGNEPGESIATCLSCQEEPEYSREDDPAFQDSLYCSADFYEAEE